MALKKFDVAYFAASCDTHEDNTRFAKQLEADYAILSDPETETAKAFGVVTEARRFPFRWTFYIGKDGKLLHIDKKVDVRSHGADIVAKLKELGVAEK